MSEVLTWPCRTTKYPEKGEEKVLLELLEERIPPGVDEAAYVKVAFLADIANGKAQSTLVSREHAAKLLGTMVGGYNIEPLVKLLESDHQSLREIAAEGLKKILLMFDAFHDVEAVAN